MKFKINCINMTFIYVRKHATEIKTELCGLLTYPVPAFEYFIQTPFQAIIAFVF